MINECILFGFCLLFCNGFFIFLTQFKNFFNKNLNKKIVNTNLYEIHITVNPENNYVKLLSFIDQYKDYKLKPVFAVSTVKNNQYMLSCFVLKYEKESIEYAKKLGELLEKENIKVERIKVESHNVSKFPTQVNNGKEFIIDPNNYFEFHVKVIVNGNTFEKLEEDVKKYTGVAISYNLCSKKLLPLLTIRIYNKGFPIASNYKDKIMNELKFKNYKFEDKIQQEYSVFDTNRFLDKGWLNTES
jgi:hypothetical protein